MKSTFSLLIILLAVVLLNCLAFADLPDTSSVVEIRVQNLNMQLAPNSQIFSEVLLPGEIADTDVNHVFLAGPFSKSESLSKEHDNIFLFIKGQGILKAGDLTYIIESESIALPTTFSNIIIQVAEGDTLHYVNVRKKLSRQDLEDIKAFPAENRNDIYFTSFNDCKAYTEKIKSPNTVSRTVLPKDHVPRVAMGTVETIGPDEVGAHMHPMLDQLFLGLAGNDVIVHADDKAVHFPEFAILHIPIGSSHWVTVDEGKRMYYQWMDFFLTKEGEVWLKTHKPIDGDPDK
jgi:quercetin dioxygenase-like cupin family protein